MAEFGDRRLPRSFWSKVELDPASGCWFWTASTRGRGYGQASVPGGRKRQDYAHRVAYTYLVGEIPPGLVVRHACDVRRCVNPDHLSLGTAADNSRDMVERGRHRGNGWALRSTCGRGHPYTPENTYVRTDGSRVCRECRRAAWRRYDLRRRGGRG